MVISITAIGVAKKGNEVLRSTAQKNDILCVTGDLGGAFTGLKVMQREKEVFLTNPKMQPQLEEYEYVVGRLLKPKARMDIIYELEEMGVKPTSMIDISDGLSSEVLHISKASNLGA
ncbi:MAG: thiamine-phosphate kinase, partial [Candidatus Nephrothrix sp. EaCA]